MKKALVFIMIISMLILCGCTPIKKEVPNIVPDSSNADSDSDYVPIITPDKTATDVPEISAISFSQRLEAETGTLLGDLKMASSRAGFSGAGYVSGFTQNPSNRLILSVDIPSNQHYNITIGVASNGKMKNILMANDEEISSFVTSGDGKFQTITISNVYLSEGATSLSIKEISGGIDLDYFEIKNSQDIMGVKLSASDRLVNINADDKTKNIMKYFADNYGKNIISGQYADNGSEAELELIHKTTGRYPAMRLGDLAPYTTNGAPQKDEIQKAIDWSNSGGLVGYTWNWEAPMNEPSCYASDTTFDITKAVTKENIALLSESEIDALFKQGKISAECVAIIKDIDAVSKQLGVLEQNGVTVLWRPLPEAGGGWYWWGINKDAYQWLWQLIYERQTRFFLLNNLIWVWNGQRPDWYVGDDMCDIISADVYADTGNQNSQINTFLQMKSISSQKIVAMSECANSPNANFMLRDKAMWSWFGVWCGEYIMDSSGKLSEEYATKRQLIDAYSHENVITFEQLPDF